MSQTSKQGCGGRGTNGAAEKKTKAEAEKTETTKPAFYDTVRLAIRVFIVQKSVENIPRHGNTKWETADLVMLLVLWAWSDNTTLTGAFREAHEMSMKMLGHAAVNSYQGLTHAILSATAELKPMLWARMQALMEQYGGDHWRIGGWVPVAFDGSRVSTPRTKENEKAFCAPNHGRSSTAKYRARKRRKNKRPRRRHSAPPAPQIWLTLFWHMGLRQLWCWRTGPSNSSEREHAADVIKNEKFPEKTLFCGDAGFTGFPLWKLLHDSGKHFLIRVGQNVTLLKNLGYVKEGHGNIVYCWPKNCVRKKNPPLPLRLICLKLGRTPVYLVTNVLDPKELSAATARDMYMLRWGIELQFRTFKQTFRRAKLRSRTPELALRELDWSLIGLGMIQVLTMKEQIAIGQPPEHSSAALAIDAIRSVFRHWTEIPLTGQTLKAKLQQAVTDQYERTKKSKRSRYQPSAPDRPHAGKPNLVHADKQLKRQLQQHLAAKT